MAFKAAEGDPQSSFAGRVAVTETLMEFAFKIVMDLHLYVSLALFGASPLPSLTKTLATKEDITKRPGTEIAETGELAS